MRIDHAIETWWLLVHVSEMMPHPPGRGYFTTQAQGPFQIPAACKQESQQDSCFTCLQYSQLRRDRPLF